MAITVTEEINATRAAVWNIVTDIDSWTDTISGIVDIEIVDRPDSGVVGLKWREKRILFGKEALETLWISAAEPDSWYETSAENHGAVYSTRVSLEESDDTVVITMTFDVRPVTIMAKLMSPVSFLFNGTIRKMLQKDLTDIRQAAEGPGRATNLPSAS